MFSQINCFSLGIVQRLWHRGLFVSPSVHPGLLDHGDPATWASEKDMLPLTLNANPKEWEKKTPAD